MSDRKTAYLATVASVEDIPGKDRIKYIGLKDLGWKVIGDSSLKEGDRVVYIEYDVVIQPSPVFEFLRKRCWSEKFQGFKIKAMKMGDCVSYGLLISIEDAIKAGAPDDLKSKSDGYDLSKTLRITALDETEEEKPTSSKKLSRWQRFIKKHAFLIWKYFYGQDYLNTNFPSWAISKSDETRIENLNYLWNDEYKGISLYTTVKVDGQSFTAAINKGTFYIAMRNTCVYAKPIKKAVKELIPRNKNLLGKHSNFIWTACNYSLATKMVAFGKKYKMNNWAIQGEQAGPGIQKNRLALKELTLFIFNVFNSDVQKYFNWPMIGNFCDETGIPSVPFIEYTTFKWNNIKEIKEYAKGSYDSGWPREGVVFRGYDHEKDSVYTSEAKNLMHGHFSFKVINDDFAVKD